MVGAIIFGVAYHHLIELRAEIEKMMPAISMFGIVYFTLVTTAAGREALLEIGLWMLVVAVLHTVLGYCCGYSLSRVMGLDALSANAVKHFESGI
jgi:BASS family bile acid:Na+ symporter